MTVMHIRLGNFDKEEAGRVDSNIVVKIHNMAESAIFAQSLGTCAF